MNMRSRISREKRTIEAMLEIYCRSKHGENLCANCQQLLVYAFNRLEKCPFQENKPACNHCTVHCYSNKRRDEIRDVMRFSGPRMLYKHPVLALGHIIDTFRKVPTLKD